MGNKHTTVKSELNQVRKRLAPELGYVALSGRYHQLPGRVEDDYDVQMNEALGQGYNGAVNLATSKTSGSKAAVKPFKLFGITKAQKRELKNEVEIFLQMDHPHVARLLDVYESETLLHVVMECLEGGELFDRITKKRKFTEQDAADAAYQMLLALNYLHGKKVVHRDIKCENFLYDKKDSNQLKLIDFGFSRIHDNANKQMHLCCGTLQYTAPEVLTGGYTNSCDLWSFGVVMFILLMGYMPFNGSDEEVGKLIKQGKYEIKENYWSRLSDEAKDFIQKLLILNAEERLSAGTALEHPWIEQRHGLRADSSELDLRVAESIVQFANASKFRQICMSMMAWSLTNEQREQVNSQFLKIDKDKQGTISLYELKTVLEETMQIDNEKAKAIFSALDNNQNEQIEYSDFLAGMMSSRISMHDGLLVSAFNRFDQDKSGFISVDELKKVLGESCKQEEIDKIMKDADLSNDGKISLEEFAEYLQGNAEREHVEVAQKVIDNEIRRNCIGQEDDADPPAEAKSLATSMEAQQGKTETTGNKQAPIEEVQNTSKSRTCVLL